MSQQLGPTYLLSVLVVIASAIAFYRAEKPPAPPSPRIVREQRVEPRPVVEAVAENQANEPIRPRLVAEAHTPPARVVTKPAPTAEPRPIQVAAPVSRPSPRGPSVTRGAFARTEEGETLKDVAQRVYGTTQKAEALWKANRDQLSSPDAALTAGMLLRTP